VIVERIHVDSSVDLYRVSYWSVRAGQPALASGLFAVPSDRAPRATVVWLNGTNTVRTDAPSMGSEVGLLISGAFAGNGFLLLAPDYLGLGLSSGHHPYLDPTATADVTIDLLRAGQELAAGVGVRWPTPLMLVGFSQGGYSTAVVHRELERHPEPNVDLRGSAALAPPMDLEGRTVPHALEGKSTGDSVYLAFLAFAWSQTLQQPLASLLTDALAARVPALFDGLHQVDEIAAELPKDPRQLFRPEGLKAGWPPWFRDALAQSEVVAWAPRAPLRLYFGAADVDVWPDDPKHAAAQMKALGGNVHLVPLGAVDHNGVVLHGVPQVLRWFAALADRP
jgi:pimeloyl-ACP methyl ester carboxylesterase